MAVMSVTSSGKTSISLVQVTNPFFSIRSVCLPGVTAEIVSLVALVSCPSTYIFAPSGIDLAPIIPVLDKSILFFSLSNLYPAVYRYSTVVAEKMRMADIMVITVLFSMCGYFSTAGGGGGQHVAPSETGR